MTRPTSEPVRPKTYCPTCEYGNPIGTEVCERCDYVMVEREPTWWTKHRRRIVVTSIVGAALVGVVTVASAVLSEPDPNGYLRELGLSEADITYLDELERYRSACVATEHDAMMWRTALHFGSEGYVFTGTGRPLGDTPRDFDLATNCGVFVEPPGDPQLTTRWRLCTSTGLTLGGQPDIVLAVESMHGPYDFEMRQAASDAWLSAGLFLRIGDIAPLLSCVDSARSEDEDGTVKEQRRSRTRDEPADHRAPSDHCEYTSRSWSHIEDRYSQYEVDLQWRVGDYAVGVRLVDCILNTIDEGGEWSRLTLRFTYDPE